MTPYRLDNFQITLDKQGVDRYTKASYPIRYGRYCEIKSSEHLYQFNLNGEIKYIQGITRNWPHPAEWLKRTDANDWIFYSIAGYNRIFDSLGEYYLPCLPYASNSIWAYNPFVDPNIQNALRSWHHLQVQLPAMYRADVSSKIQNFLDLVVRNDAQALKAKSEKLHQINGGQVSVLPPDTRHVDYEVIPIIIADGCLYDCSFCRIKSGRQFAIRSNHNIRQQIQGLKKFYGDNLINYNAVFLGNHDALAAGHEPICRTAAEVYKALNFEKAHISDPRLFIFGSVDSLLNADHNLFEALNQLPFFTHINIGLESVDKATLARIQKPLDTQKVEAAFIKMIHVNRSYLNIEITANFLIGMRLSAEHYESIIELMHRRLDCFYSKGGIYLSPLDTRGNHHDQLRIFFRLKNLSRLPTFIYLIQRL